jgi:hypothetical protein
LVPLYFNTEENLDYVGPLPDISFYGVDDMSGGERKEFFAWNERQKLEIFDNRRVLESYSQDYVRVLRHTCRVFRREFRQIGYI